MLHKNTAGILLKVDRSSDARVSLSCEVDDQETKWCDLQIAQVYETRRSLQTLKQRYGST